MSQSTLERARSGNEQAFGELVDPYRRQLHLHCYRMLGSPVDADDALQETLLAAWRGLDGFAGRSSLRAWLYRIATNRCLNTIRDGARRRPAEPVPPFDPPPPTRQADVPWLQPYPDAWLDRIVDREPDPAARYQALETVELAFVAALQRLPPRQMAALLLLDVLGFSTREAAAMLDTTATAVKGAVQRARAALDRSATANRAPRRGDPAAERELARRFATAFAEDDIDTLLGLLTDDAWLAMPPAPHEYQGRDAIAAFLRSSARWRGPRRFRLVPTRANTQPAFGCYLNDLDGVSAGPAGLVVLTVRVDRIQQLTRFLAPGLHRRFDLPERLA